MPPPAVLSASSLGRPGCSMALSCVLISCLWRPFQLINSFFFTFRQVQARYLGNDGELKNLQDLIDADHKAMTKDTAVIAGGSTGAVVGLLVIASGVLLEFETAGTSTALIVGGVVVIVVSGAAIGIAAADYQKKAEELKKSVTKLAHLSTEITVATSLKQHLANLSSTGSAALGALSKMEAQWTTLASTMQVCVCKKKINRDTARCSQLPVYCPLRYTACSRWCRRRFPRRHMYCMLVIFSCTRSVLCCICGINPLVRSVVYSFSFHCMCMCIHILSRL